MFLQIYKKEDLEHMSLHLVLALVKDFLSHNQLHLMI